MISSQYCNLVSNHRIVSFLYKTDIMLILCLLELLIQAFKKFQKEK